MDLLTPEFGLFFWTLIAFLAVFFILGKFAWKPILGMLGEREAGIAESLATADRVRKEMSQMQSETEKLMKQAREERTVILKEAKEIKDNMINEAKEQAKVEANKIIADAQQQIHLQKMTALTEVKNEMSNLALQVAEKILRKQLATGESQAAYINQLADDIKMN